MWLHRMELFKRREGVVDLEQGFRTPFHIHAHTHTVQANNSLLGESILLTMKPKAIRFKRRKPFETRAHTQPTGQLAPAGRVLSVVCGS